MPRKMGAIILLQVFLNGCSTMGTMQTPEEGPLPVKSYRPYRVYSGTLMDMVGIGNMFTGDFGPPDSGGTFWVIPDLPFSLAADTLVLPVTVSQQYFFKALPLAAL